MEEKTSMGIPSHKLSKSDPIKSCQHGKYTDKCFFFYPEDTPSLHVTKQMDEMGKDILRIN